MVGYAVRITRTAEQLYDVARRWKDYCDTIIMYEHPDDVANRTHCHMYLGRVSVTTKRLKQVSGLPNLGNTLWSFKEATEDISVYVTYMSKGKYDPSYLYRYEYKDTERLKALWKEPEKPVKPALKAYMEFEQHARTLPVELRLHTEDITRLATRWIYQRDLMFNQANQNQVRNYTQTYVFKYNLFPRPLV